VLRKTENPHVFFFVFCFLLCWLNQPTYDWKINEKGVNIGKDKFLDKEKFSWIQMGKENLFIVN
jgi:hypothetical protein